MYTKIFISALLLSSIFIYPAAQQLRPAQLRCPSGKQPAAAQDFSQRRAGASEETDDSMDRDAQWQEFMDQRIAAWCAGAPAYSNGGAAAEKGPSVDSSDDAVELIDVACADGSLSAEQAAGAAQAADTQRELQLWQSMYWDSYGFCPCAENPKLLKKYEGINPNYTHEGTSLLELALKYRRRQLVVEFLCEHGADVNAFNAEGHLPIHVAVRYGNMSAYEYLIKHGAKLGDLNDLLLVAAACGWRTLQPVCESLCIGPEWLTPEMCVRVIQSYGSSECLDHVLYFHKNAPGALAQSGILLLLARQYYLKGLKFGSLSRFARMIDGQRNSTIPWLLENYPDMVQYVDSYGNTVLHYLWCDAALLKLALQHGAECHINAQNNVGNTPIMHMLEQTAPGVNFPLYQKDVLPALKQFLKNGARISYVNQQGNHAAFAYHSAKVIRACLAQLEADPNWINKVSDSDNPNTPIWFSVKGLKELKTFESAGADMGVCDGHGVPYILHAVRRAPRAVVDYMLKYNFWRLFNKDGTLVADIHGNTVFHMLAQRVAIDDEELGLFEEITAAVKGVWSNRTDYRMRWLDEVRKKRAKSLTKLAHVLASYDSNGVHVRNNDGDTPLHSACRKSWYSENVEALVSIGAVPHALNHAGQTPIDLVAATVVVPFEYYEKELDVLGVENPREFHAKALEVNTQKEAALQEVRKAECAAKRAQEAAAQQVRREAAIARFHAAEKARR